MDGADAFDGSRPTFHRARRPSRDDLIHLPRSLSGCIVRLLERSGVLSADEAHPSLECAYGRFRPQVDLL
jgi:hypothetical protein